MTHESLIPVDPEGLVGYPLTLGPRIVVLTLGWLACLSGVFGNVLIITTLLSQQALRSVHNIYIANLAVADLLVVGYVSVFWLLDLSLGYQPVAGMMHCKINAFILSTCIVCSIYTLVQIALNRYLSVCHNDVFKKVYSMRSTMIMILFTWIISGFLSSFAFMEVGGAMFVYNLESHLCTFDASDPANIYSVLTSVNLVLPAWLIGFFSLSIFKFWKRSRSRIKQWNRTQNNAEQDQPPQGLGQGSNTISRPGGGRISSSDVALVRTLVLVFVLLVVLYLPVAVGLSLDAFHLAPVSSDAYSFLVLMLFSNHSINWIVYGLLNKNFMEGYKRLLTRCKGVGTSSDSTAPFDTSGTNLAPQ